MPGNVQALYEKYFTLITCMQDTSKSQIHSTQANRALKTQELELKTKLKKEEYKKKQICEREIKRKTKPGIKAALEITFS